MSEALSSSSAADDATPKQNVTAVPTINNTTQLLQYGVCRVPFFDSEEETTEHDSNSKEEVDSTEHNNNNKSNEEVVLQNGPLPHHISSSSTTPFPIEEWISNFTTVSPYQQMMEGDLEYALYRNIMDEEDFPFVEIYNLFVPTLLRYFGIVEESELELDDAFCVHYNMDQYDTSGAKHMDPSDITINICLECTSNVQGSQVKFYGTQPLVRRNKNDDKESVDDVFDEHTRTTPIPPLSSSSSSSSRLPHHIHHQQQQDEFQFLVEQVQGYATVHWGHHAHQTMPLTRGGRRTNLILTYRYTDPDKRQNVALRTCYGGQ